MKNEPFKIKAIITIDIDASDAYEIEAHRRRLNEALQELQASYDAPKLEIKSRRPRRAPRAAAPPKLGPEFEIVRARYAG